MFSLWSENVVLGLPDRNSLIPAGVLTDSAFSLKLPHSVEMMEGTTHRALPELSHHCCIDICPVVLRLINETTKKKR